MWNDDLLTCPTFAWSVDRFIRPYDPGMSMASTDSSAKNASQPQVWTFLGPRERVHQPLFDMLARGIGISTVRNAVNLFENAIGANGPENVVVNDAGLAPREPTSDATGPIVVVTSIRSTATTPTPQQKRGPFLAAHRAFVQARPTPPPPPRSRPRRR